MAGTPDEADADRQTGLRVTLRSLWRFLVVVSQFLPLVAAYARDRRRFVLFGRSRRVSTETQRRRAEYLKTTLLGLGPTFIKLGQILSTRPDALPRTYTDVLSELQDKVPPDDWATVEPVIEADVGPVDEAFDAFDTDPISGASLGQVYTARLDGEPVAVKVLRPGIREVVEADLRVISTLTPLLVRFAPPGQAFTLEGLGEEFADTIRREMDYGQEARMLSTMRGNFADDPLVVVPRPYDDYCTDRVVTMEYVDGTKIDDLAALDAMGIDREALTRRLEEVYIQMIVEDGTFHADPHPGNLAVKPDGAIVFYDFGMCGSIDAHTREQILEFYVGVASDDIDRVIDAFVAMDALDPDVDRELMYEVFDLALDQFRGEDISEYQIQELVSQFESQLYDFPLRLPQNLALIVRVTTVLEGVARTLDPEFDFIDVITDYVMSGAGGRVDDDGAAGPSLRDEVVERYVADASDLAEGFLRGFASVPPKLDRTLDRVERGDATVNVRIADTNRVFGRLARRLVLTFLTAATALTVTMLYAFEGLREAGVVALSLPVFGFLLYRALRRRRGIRAKPQFTRQAMRDRKGRK